MAESDLSLILEDSATGFGWSIKLTAPSGNNALLTGFSDDIAQIIDPDTGQAASGRMASVAIRIASIYAALPDDGLPKGVADSKYKPWVIEFDDINGKPYKFKVYQSNPDRALGLITLILETYR